MRQAYDYWQDQPGSYPHGDVPDPRPLSQAKGTLQPQASCRSRRGWTFQSLPHFLRFLHSAKGHQRRRAQNRLSFHPKQAELLCHVFLPTQCDSKSMLFERLRVRRMQERTSAKERSRFPSNDAKHISHQRPSPTTSHHLLRCLRKHRSIPISNLAARPKSLTNCFSSTPGRLQMTREPYV